jgi:hypothetical protein
MVTHDAPPYEGHHGEIGSAYWEQWTSPPTIITVIVAAVTLYGSHVIQAERLDTMRARVEMIERDYQRRDVLAEQLRSIDTRLGAIEKSVGAKRPTDHP